MMNRLKAYLCCAFLAGGMLPGVFAAEQALAAPASGSLKTGTLPNGLTYYIRSTEAQPGLAGFYLVQNVGALMEEEDQKGLAHFLEHMAFNASENFPGQIDRFLQGRNITRYNAYTAQDETVYNIDNVPTADGGAVDSCLLVLRDWCHFLTFPEQGIEKERGIILEEWRTRRDAVARAREQIVGALYNGSRYSTRDAIGDKAVLESFRRDQLKAYYDRWYRPDLQAVIVVGDIDAERIEQFIRDRFSDLPQAQNPEPRPNYTIPESTEPRYVRVVDKELEGVAMEFTQRITKLPTPTTPEELIRRIVIRDLFNRMIGARLAQLTTGEDQTLYGASISYDGLLRGYDGNTISITPYPGRDFRALSRVLEVWETVRKLGFTAPEFDLQCRQMLRQAEGFEQNLDQVGYGVYATLYQNHYLTSTPIVEPSERGDLMRKVLASLRVEQVNDWMKGWAEEDANRVFIVTGNDPAYDYLTLEDIIAAEQDVRESNLEQPAIAAEIAPLIDFELVPVKVVAERKLPIGEATEWRFANGAQVCFKRADIGSGRFRLEGVSEGGYSLVAERDIPSAEAVEALTFASGVYKTDRSAMIELMQNHDMDIAFRLQSRKEVIAGRALSDDADRFFELFFLGLTRMRFDEAEFARYVNELRLSLETRRRTDLDRVMDTVKMLNAKPSPRVREVDAAYVSEIDAQRVEAIFRDRFCNPADFVFYLVGDLTEAEARAYASKYIGTLPPAASRKRERSIDHRSTERMPDVERLFEAALPDDKALVDLSFSDNRKIDRRESVAFWLLGVILNSRCTDELRERRGGTYNVHVGTRYNESANPRRQLSIHFETSAPKVDQMKAAVYKELDDLLRGGVTTRDVESVVSAQKQRLAAQPRNTDFWVAALYNYQDKGEDQTRADYHTSTLEAMTPALIRSVASVFLRDARKMDIVVRAKTSDVKTENNTDK